MFLAAWLSASNFKTFSQSLEISHSRSVQFAYSPLNSAKFSCSSETTLGHMTCHIFGALAHFCKTMHKTLLSKIVFIEEAVCKKKERTICFFDNFQKPSEPHSMGKYILTLQLDFSKNPVLEKN